MTRKKMPELKPYKIISDVVLTLNVMKEDREVRSDDTDCLFQILEV